MSVVLIIGGGGREHALSYLFSKSPRVTEIRCAPGNPGMATLGTCFPGPISIDTLPLEGVDLVVIGPEAPLVAGLADELRLRGIPVCGPSKAAAQLEGSKQFAKEIMTAARVPTASYTVCNNISDVLTSLKNYPNNTVVKLDGLAGGKGVVVTDNVKDAEIEAYTLLGRNPNSLVIMEERLEGVEISLLALCDGTNWVALSSSEDHKQLYDGDKGPNTGGMGAYSPSPLAVTQEELDALGKVVIEPILQELNYRNISYQGVLYAGLMITDHGVKVLEYNCRFGDPEIQTLAVRWKDDPYPWFLGAAKRFLPQGNPVWSDNASVCVVIASEGYPDYPITDRQITGVEEANDEHTTVFHASTSVENGVLMSSGGRVLNITSTGKTLQEAHKNAYNACEKVYLHGSHYRRDIANRPHLK